MEQDQSGHISRLIKRITFMEEIIMSYTNETAMVNARNFILPATMDSGFDREDLGDDFEGLQLSFKKFKIPGGGTTQFEDPSSDPENPD